jgi:hypothetical protein
LSKVSLPNVASPTDATGASVGVAAGALLAESPEEVLSLPPPHAARLMASTMAARRYPNQFLLNIVFSLNLSDG